jgi:hypothetical protein
MRDSKMNQLARLVAWTASMADGDWEHRHCFNLENLDNPGWKLTVAIDMDYLPPDGEYADLEHDQRNWIRWKVENGVFEGSCGNHRLAELLEAFLEVAEAHASKLDEAE